MGTDSHQSEEVSYDTYNRESSNYSPYNPDPDSLEINYGGSGFMSSDDVVQIADTDSDYTDESGYGYDPPDEDEYEDDEEYDDEDEDDYEDEDEDEDEDKAEDEDEDDHEDIYGSDEPPSEYGSESYTDGPA